MGYNRCQKCLQGAMTVHVGTHGLCNECESERAWKNSKRVATQQRNRMYRHRIFMEKSAELKRRVKEEFGDDED